MHAQQWDAFGRGRQRRAGPQSAGDRKRRQCAIFAQRCDYDVKLNRAVHRRIAAGFQKQGRIAVPGKIGEGALHTLFRQQHRVTRPGKTQPATATAIKCNLFMRQHCHAAIHEPAQQRRAFFEKQLSLVQAKMIAAEQALRATGVNSSVLKSNPTSAVAAVAALKAQVTAQEVKVGAMRGYLADTAPDFKQALNELSNLRAQLAKQEKDEPASAAGQGDYVAKYREFKYQETLFDLFAKQFELAKIDESREGANIEMHLDDGSVQRSDGPYDGPAILQKAHPLTRFEGGYPLIGSWVIGDHACGIGIREDDSAITRDSARFVPHAIIDEAPTQIYV